jgi:hypothetical protein
LFCANESAWREFGVAIETACDDLSRRIARPYRVLISDFSACLIT